MVPKPNSTGRRPLRADALRNREQILDAAEREFTQRGDAASLDEIARHAGVGAGTLYRRFPDRAALLRALLDDRVSRLCQEAEQALLSPDPDGALTRWLRAVVHHADSFGGAAASILIADVGRQVATDNDPHGALLKACASLLAHAKDAGTTRGELEPADLLRHAGAISTAARQATQPEETTERMFNVFADGLLDRRPRRR